MSGANLVSDPANHVHVTVRSADRFSLGDHSGDFEVGIPTLASGYVMRYVGVSQLRIPNRWYNISTFPYDIYKAAGSTTSARSNLVFSITVNGTLSTITLVPGYYTTSRLFAALADALAVAAYTTPYVSARSTVRQCTAATFTEDPVTGLVTFTYTTIAGNLQINETPLAVQLGFMAKGAGATTAHATTQVTSSMPALPRPLMLQITSEQLANTNHQLNKNFNDDNQEVSRSFRMLVQVQQDSEFGEDLIYAPEEPDWMAFDKNQAVPQGNVRIRVRDEAGNILQLNSDWVMTLVYTPAHRV